MDSENCENCENAENVPPSSPRTSQLPYIGDTESEFVPGLQRLPQPPPPLQRPQQSCQSMPRASCRPALTATRDVVKMFIMSSLYKFYGKPGIVAFDHEQFYDWQDHQILQSIRITGECWDLDQRRVQVRRHITCHILSCAGEESRARFCGTLSDVLFNRKPAEGHTISWSTVAMGVFLTGYMIEVLAVRDPLHLRMHELIEWCYLYYRSMGIDKWIEENGGWGQIIAEVTF